MKTSTFLSSASARARFVRVTSALVAAGVLLPAAAAQAAPGDPRPPRAPAPGPAPAHAPAADSGPAAAAPARPGDRLVAAMRPERPAPRPARGLEPLADSSPTGLRATQSDAGLVVSFVPPTSLTCPGIVDYEYTVNGSLWATARTTVSPVTITDVPDTDRLGIRLRAVTDTGRCAESGLLEFTPRRIARDDFDSNPQVNSRAFYSYDGSGNNARNTAWGAAGTSLLRKAAVGYADGVSAPAGATRPSARVVSNALSEQESSIVNDRDLSDIVYVWGQFLDHDIDLSSGGSESMPIAVPAGDPWFDPSSTGTKSIGLRRSVVADGTGTSASNPRQQVNAVTAFVDGSQVYGSDQTRADALRTFTGGRLATSAGNMLPFNTSGLANANDSHLMADTRLFAAGDVRANENPDLVSMQTLFMREHNRVADEFADDHPQWTDEQLYQAARQVVIAELQAITYNEFLPALLGSSAVRPYSGYRADVDPSIANEFSTAAFRFGHSLLDSELSRLNDDGSPAGSPISLAEALFNTGVFDATAPGTSGGIDPFLKAAASGNAQEVDLAIVDDLRNMLFGAPGQGGLDLAALNIQRGRDHGLADYNSARAAYGLPRVTSFAQISADPQVQRQLAALYGSVDNIDLWVGGLAERHAPGSSVGPLFQRIIADQFTRLRDGDRNWYQAIFSGPQRRALDGTRLSDIIERNTSLTTLQSNAFIWRG